MSNHKNTVVVTGAGGRLGREFSAALAKVPCNVVLADIDLASVEQVASDLKRAGHMVHAVKADITSKQSVEALLQETIKTFNRCDALINNAYPRNPNFNRPFYEVEYRDFCENLNLHLGGYFLASQVFARHLQQQGSGSIINIASIYGVIAPRFDIYEGTSMTTGPEYPAIKSGVITLTRYMAQFLKGSGVTVNSICPGGIEAGQPESFLAAYRSYCNTKGMLSPQDVSGLVVFLTSPEARFITGQNITIDDGFTL